MEFITNTFRHLSGDLVGDLGGNQGDDVKGKTVASDTSLGDQEMAGVNPSTTSFAPEVETNGDGNVQTLEPKDDKNDDSENKQLDTSYLDNCGECKKLFSSSRLKGSTQCSLCDMWFCQTCTKLKKGDVTIGRNDVFWACKPCKPKIEELLSKSAQMGDSIEISKAGGESINLDTIKDTIEAMVDSIKEMGDSMKVNKAGCKSIDLDVIKDTIEATIKHTIKREIAPVVDECLSPVKRVVEETVRETVKTELPPAVYQSFQPLGEMVKTTVEKSVENTWASLFYGDEFPDMNSPAAANAPIKPKLTMTTVFKRAAAEQKRDETRQKNVVLHRATESQEQNIEARQQEDEKTVEDLLTHLGVEHEPVKITRLGKFDQENDTKSRPLKIEFESAEAQSDIMRRAYKLSSASETLKKISVSYDMNRDEQETCRTLVKKAKEDSKNSTTHKYKVVGRPGEMAIKGFPLQK